MTKRLPGLNAREVIRALERADFFVERSSGSHHPLVHRTHPRRRATVPDHGSRDIPRGTLRNILRQAALSRAAWCSQAISGCQTSRYQATKRWSPSSIGVLGRKPTARSRSSMSAQVATTSPGCIGR